MHTEPYKKNECIFQVIVKLLKICPNVHLVIVRIYIHKYLSHLGKTLQRYFFLNFHFSTMVWTKSYLQNSTAPGNNHHNNSKYKSKSCQIDEHNYMPHSRNAHFLSRKGVIYFVSNGTIKVSNLILTEAAASRDHEHCSVCAPSNMISIWHWLKVKTNWRKETASYEYLQTSRNKCLQ